MFFVPRGAGANVGFYCDEIGSVPQGLKAIWVAGVMYGLKPVPTSRTFGIWSALGISQPSLRDLSVMTEFIGSEVGMDFYTDARASGRGLSYHGVFMEMWCPSYGTTLSILDSTDSPTPCPWETQTISKTRFSGMPGY
jgi:hypothetical protein